MKEKRQVYHSSSKKVIKRRKPNRSLSGDFFIYFMLTCVAIIMMIPMVFAISSALKPLDELFRFPPSLFAENPTFDNFSDLFVTLSQSWVTFSRYFANTFFITFVGTIGHMIIASMAAFVLSKYVFPGSKGFFNLVVVSLMFTGYVTGIPNFITMSRLGIIDTYFAIILPAFAGPLGLFLMKQFCEGIPQSLIEAAKIDGANEWGVFIRIIMPNVKPAWLTLMIFSIRDLWNNGATTVIYSEEKKPLTYALSQVLAGGVARTGQASAVTVVVMIVPIICFILSESQVMQTMATSGIKE